MKKIILLSTLFPFMAMATTYSIGDKVWYDKNQDWEQNLDEKGYPDVKVNLFNENGEKIKSTITNEDGAYQFSNIPEGEYTVGITPPQGISLVTEAPIQLWLEENRHDINFGIFKPIAYSVSGNIWNDKNSDWEMRRDEPKVANVTVELYNAKGKKIATTKTNSKGVYKFSKLSEGEYSVKVIETQSLKMITESPLELWVESNQNNINFGVFTSTVSTPAITREQLISMINSNEDVTKVNTSEITDMHDLFKYKKRFNQDISNWDVSNVTNMNRMFANAIYFNQDISKWDVSKVTNMNSMFSNYKSLFNQPLNSWDVSNVTSMVYMFSLNTVFNQPLDKWDVSKVTDMRNMFHRAKKFNQPLNNWNVSNVTNMEDMFESAIHFNQPLNSWNVSNVTNMKNMFYGTSFNQPLNNWDVSNVTTMYSMFSRTNFNQPLDGWNVSNVTNMYFMFLDARSFDQPLNSWDVSKVTIMRQMFHGAYSFNQPLNNWNVSNVTNMIEMFKGADDFNQNISNWDVSKVKSYGDFADSSVLKEAYQPKFK